MANELKAVPDLARETAASLAAGNSAPFVYEATGIKPGEWDWDELNALVRPRFLRLAMGSYGFTKEEAEDILQTVYMRVLARDPRVKEPVGYLKVAFVNTCINAVIGRSRIATESLSEVGEDQAVDRCDERLIGRLHAVKVVTAAIRSATPRCKRIVKLYFGEDYKLSEMCQVTGYSKKTVWKRIWSCLSKMREAVAA